ncbi:MAG TPA: hypothetical protein VK154_11015 [Chitinophagales bacterium]|nr:hypothetical protein [Chitinophagales bacterium]
MLHPSIYHGKFFVALSLLLALCLPACKKDKAEINNSITGSWVTLQSQYGNSQYYLFTADGKLYKMNTSLAGYPEVQYFIYSFSNDQITVQGGDQYNPITNLYNVRFSGDTAFFNDGNADQITLLKDNGAPKQVSDFVIPLSTTDKFTDTAKATGITYKDGKLYTFKYYSGPSVSRFIEYNTATRAVSASVVSDYAYSGLDFTADGILWCVLYQHAYVFNIPTATNSFQSATLTGNSLWATAAGNGVLYNYATAAYITYDIAADDFGQEREVDNDVTDLAYADGYLYVAKAGMLYKKHTYYSGVLESYYLDNYEIRGVAHATGNDFWLAARNNTTGVNEMVKVTL